MGKHHSLVPTRLKLVSACATVVQNYQLCYTIPYQERRFTTGQGCWRRVIRFFSRENGRCVRLSVRKRHG